MNHWLYRLIAYVIDYVIVLIPAWIIYALIEPLLWRPVSLFGIAYSTSPWWAGYLLLPLLTGIIQVLYFTILDVSWGATIGKRLLGLNVRMVNGARVTFDKALIRNLSKIYGLFVLLDWIIGVATPGADNRQKYTDRIAGTTVVSIKQPFASSGVPPPPPPPPPT